MSIKEIAFAVLFVSITGCRLFQQGASIVKQENAKVSAQEETLCQTDPRVNQNLDVRFDPSCRSQGGAGCIADLPCRYDSSAGMGSKDRNPAQTDNPDQTNPLPPAPAKLSGIVAGYYPNWTEAPLRLRDVNPNYNMIYLFAARPVGGAPGTTGAVEWTPPGDGRGAATHFKEDLKHVREVQGRRIILSVGGAGFGMSFPNRQKSQTFLDSIVSLYQEWGGFDGLDWNTFEADQVPDVEEMIWISLELKRIFPGFLITAPPAPWKQRDKDFCAAMVKAGAMDYAAPQYYDGPDLATQSYIVQNVEEWITLLGPSHVMLGFGIWDQAHYMGIADALATWTAVKGRHPEIGGAFNWMIHLDEQQGWPFANSFGPWGHKIGK